MEIAKPPSLTGRVAELKEIGDAVAAARIGQPSTVLIRGEPGIGKTRLVSEAIDSFIEQDDILAIARGVDLIGGELPFGVVTSLLRDLVEKHGTQIVTDTGSDLTEALSALVPSLGERRSRSPDRLRIFDAFQTLVTRIARQRLTLLVVDDVQWADTTSLDLLAYLTRQMTPPSRLLIAFTVREPDDQNPLVFDTFVEQLVRGPATRTLHLARLTPAELGDMVITRRGQTSEHFLDRILALSEGVPFLVEELVASGMTEDGPVPRSVTTMMVSRVAALSPEAQLMIRVSSLGEGHLLHRLMAPVSGLTDEGTLETAIRESVGAKVLDVDDSGDGYRFHHALMREAMVTTLLPGDLERWHRRWAEALDSDAAEPFNRIRAAHHWGQTQDVQRAFDAALDAAELAGSMGAASERAELLTRALDLWFRVPDLSGRTEEDRIDVVEDVILARIQASELADAVSLLDAQLRSPQARQNPVLNLHLRLMRTRFAERLKLDVDESLDVEAAIRVLSEAALSRVYLRALARLVNATFSSESLGRLAPLMEQAALAAPRIGRAQDQLMIGRARIALLNGIGQLEDAADLSLELLPWVRQHFAVVDVAMMESICTWSLAVKGQFRDAVDLGRSAFQRIVSPRLARWASAFLLENLTYALFELGRWDEALEAVEQGVELVPEGDNAVFLEVTAGAIAAYRGDTSTASRLLRSSRGRLAPDAPVGNPVAYEWTQWLEAEVMLALHRPAEARDAIAPLLQMPELRTDAFLWRSVLTALRAENDMLQHQSAARGRHEGQEAAEARISQITEVASDIPAVAGVGAAWQAQVVAEKLRCQGSIDPKPWQRAADGWGATGQLHDRAWALVRLAECALGSRDASAARDALQEAIETGDSLGAKPVLDAAHVVAARGHISVGTDERQSRPTTGRHGLTPREFDVLRLVCEGKNNEQVATTLFISPKTASVHVSRILAKLGVSSRTEAAALAHREGLVSDG